MALPHVRLLPQCYCDGALRRYLKLKSGRRDLVNRTYINVTQNLTFHQTGTTMVSQYSP